MKNDTFNGDNAKLVESIKALLALDESGSLVPHGVGGHARQLLSAAASRLSASIADTAGAKRLETTSENIARDIREGRFPQRSEPQMIAATPASSVADAAGASEHLPENIDWTRVMALAEEHGDGWSDEKGWSFHCDDDLFNFAGELAKESGK